MRLLQFTSSASRVEHILGPLGNLEKFEDIDSNDDNVLSLVEWEKLMRQHDQVSLFGF